MFSTKARRAWEEAGMNPVVIQGMWNDEGAIQMGRTRARSLQGRKIVHSRGRIAGYRSIKSNSRGQPSHGPKNGFEICANLPVPKGDAGS
jgi:hypothetical protein